MDDEPGYTMFDPRPDASDVRCYINPLWAERHTGAQSAGRTFTMMPGVVIETTWGRYGTLGTMDVLLSHDLE